MRLGSSSFVISFIIVLMKSIILLVQSGAPRLEINWLFLEILSNWDTDIATTFLLWKPLVIISWLIFVNVFTFSHF